MELPNLTPNINIDPGIQFAYSTSQKTICIIGAGAAGLAAIKAVLDSEQFKSDKWIPVAFESREDIGGVWLPAPPTSDPPLTPLYDCLTTNLPHPVMAFTSFSFPPGTPLFPDANIVQQYLKDYTDYFSLSPHIKFKTTITSVSLSPPNSPRRWLVETSSNESYYFDLVIVCNGHHHIPRYPSLPGLGDWINAHKAIHSVYYRHPLPTYKDKNILIVGAGPSGHDLAVDLQPLANKIILAGAGPNSEEGGVTHRGHVTSFDDLTTGTVTFEDGTIEEGVDFCILATGYCQHFPFLPSPLIQNSSPPPIPPLPKELYNSTYSLFPLAQHLWPLTCSSLYPPETLAFVGLLVRVAPFPLVEVQARAVLRAFDSLERGVEGGGLDQQAEAVEIVTRWEKLKAKLRDEEKVNRVWHKFEGLEQFDYRDLLSKFAERNRSVGSKSWAQELLDDVYVPQDKADDHKEVIRVRDWEKEMYSKKDVLRKVWVKLEKNGEAEKWVEGVGEGGIEEWVDLMRRLVKLGELESGISDDGKARL